METTARDAEFREWDRKFQESVKDGLCNIPDRSQNAARALFRHVEKWYGETPDAEKAEVPYYYLSTAQDLIARLDGVLHQSGGPLENSKYGLWQHQDFAKMASLKPGELDWFIETDVLTRLASEYLRMPWVQTAQLDWIMLDGIIASTLASMLREYLPIKLGAGWIVFNGNRIKAALWRAFVTPTWIAASWIVPAAIAIFCLSRWPWSGWISGPLCALYYAFSIWGLTRWIFFHLRRIVTREPSPLAQFEKIIDDVAAAYGMLSGSMIHIRTLRAAVEKAMNLKPILPQVALYLLDHVEARHEMWSPHH